MNSTAAGTSRSRSAASRTWRSSRSSWSIAGGQAALERRRGRAQLLGHELAPGAGRSEPRSDLRARPDAVERGRVRDRPCQPAAARRAWTCASTRRRAGRRHHRHVSGARRCVRSRPSRRGRASAVGGVAPCAAAPPAGRADLVDQRQHAIDAFARDGAAASRMGASASSSACARSAISRCLTTRAAPFSVCARRSRRATASAAARPSRARARPARAARGARAPRCGSTCSDPPLVVHLQMLRASPAACTRRSRSRDSAASCEAVCSVWPELASVSRVAWATLAMATFDLLDGGGLLLGRQLDLARGLAWWCRRARRSA